MDFCDEFNIISCQAKDETVQGYSAIHAIIKVFMKRVHHILVIVRHKPQSRRELDIFTTMINIWLKFFKRKGWNPAPADGTVKNAVIT
jgi:hypothetical protein